MGHAIYSPSAAPRWVNCPGSVSREGLEEEEDRSTKYADEGTAAHELLAHVLTEGIDPFDCYLEGRQYNGFEVNFEMAGNINELAEQVRNYMRDGEYELTVEEHVTGHHIHPDLEGTLDISMFSEVRKHLVIGDLKYGAGVHVVAKLNWQQIIYADCKVEQLEMLGYQVDTVSIWISQPRHWKHKFLIDPWDLTVKELRAYRKTIEAAIKDSKTRRAGKWCRFCPHSGNCETQDAFVGEAIPHDLHTPDDYPELVASRTPEQLAEILDRQEAVNMWFKAVYGHAYSLAKLGTPIPGYAIKETKGNRKYVDVAEAEETLLAEFGEIIYEDRVLRSPAQMEKIKGAKTVVAGLVHKPVTGEALVKEKD